MITLGIILGAAVLFALGMACGDLVASVRQKIRQGSLTDAWWEGYNFRCEEQGQKPTRVIIDGQTGSFRKN